MTMVRVRPMSVTVAVGGLLAQAAFAIVNVVLILVSTGTLRDSMEAAAREEGLSSYDTKTTVEAGMAVNIVGGVALSAVLVVVTLLLVRMLLHGRPAGRTRTIVACWVMLGMTLLSLCFGMLAVDAVPGWWFAFTLLGNLFYIAVYLTVIHMLYRPAALRFFTPASTPHP